MLQYPRHPLSALLPALTADEITGLRMSIEAIGVQEPATVYQEQILDGWNRYTLAAEQGVPCPLRQLPEGVDPVEFVRSTVQRRHLTVSALALLEVELNNWRPSGERARGEPGSPLGATNAEMAARAGASERTIQKAKAASHATEAVKEAIKAGKVSVKRGAELAQLPAEEQAAALVAPPVPKFAAAPLDVPPPISDPGFQSPTDLLEEQEAEIRRLTEQLAAASADDTRAELIKLKTALQVAERRQGELMGEGARLQADLRTASNTIRQLCDLLDLADTRKLVAAVKALKAKTEA
jgi:hypothetical protein